MTTIAEHQSVVIQHLLKTVADLQDRVMVLEAGLFNVVSDKIPEINEIREISREQAKAEIIELFATGETLYHSDLSDRLSLDYDLVIEICRELVAEGAIRVDPRGKVR